MEKISIIGPHCLPRRRDKGWKLIYTVTRQRYSDIKGCSGCHTRVLSHFDLRGILVSSTQGSFSYSTVWKQKMSVWTSYALHQPIDILFYGQLANGSQRTLGINFNEARCNLGISDSCSEVKWSHDPRSIYYCVITFPVYRIRPAGDGC